MPVARRFAPPERNLFSSPEERHGASASEAGECEFVTACQDENTV
jgi:hypothetical protein